MHGQVLEFCQSVKTLYHEKFKEKSVLDIGSLDINGNNRYLFDGCKYFGIDIINGNNVDMACMAHKIIGSFDVVISTEAFEHDMYLDKTLKHICKVLKPNGLFLFTCATTGRREHGTNKVHPELSATSKIDGWSDYYKNVTEDIVRNSIDIERNFKKHKFNVSHKEHDLQFWGIKK